MNNDHHESTIPRPPISSIEAMLEQNRLSSTARATLSLAWRNVEEDDSHYTSLDILEDPLLYVEFWEDTAVAPLPHFDAIVAEVREHPEKFTKQMIIDMSAFAAPLDSDYDHCLTDAFVLGEDEAILQLEDYLATVLQVSENDNSEINNLASGLKDQLGYLDEARLEIGIEAISSVWIEYLNNNPEAQFNIFKRQNVKNNKSFEYILEKIKEKIIEKDLGAALRVVDHPDAWKDGEGSKVIILDDWIISGQTSAKMVSQAMQELEKQHLTSLKDDIEVHTIAREVSASAIPGVVYRSIYLHDSGTDYDQVSMTGSHSAVNYGFEHPLRRMQKYMQKKGIFIPSPLLMATEPTDYRDIHISRAIGSDKKGTLMRSIAEENMIVLETLEKIYKLEKRIYRKESDKNTSLKELHEALGKKQAPEEGDDSDVVEVVKLRIALKNLSEERAALRSKLGLKRDRV